MGQLRLHLREVGGGQFRHLIGGGVEGKYRLLVRRRNGGQLRLPKRKAEDRERRRMMRNEGRERRKRTMIGGHFRLPMEKGERSRRRRGGGGGPRPRRRGEGALSNSLLQGLKVP